MAVITGTDNPETLNGTAGDDTITGLKGDDILNGLGGADLFVWSRGDGADTVNGGDGSDTFQATIPYYESTRSGNQFQTEEARIEVDANTGDLIFDSFKLDSTRIQTGFLNDERDFQKSNLHSIEHLQIIGGTADPPAPYTELYVPIQHSFSTADNFVLPNLTATSVQDVSFDGGSGNDTFDATAAGVAIIAHGGTGNDVLNGGSGTNTLDGDDGNDVLRAGSGPSTLIGGTGDDVYFVNKASDVITELSGEGNDAVFASSSSYTLSANVENLFHSGTQSFTGIGNAGDNWIQGGTGSDYLIGLDGNDTLYDGGGAPDALQGGKGDDTYIVDAAGDGLIEFAGEGHDRVLTTLTSFTLSANIEDLSYSGIQGFTGIGNELTNTIQGGSGNDVLSGLGGDNVLNGGGGSDTADYSAAPAAITASLATGHGLNGYGGTDTYISIENITGSNYDDTIIGDGGNNTLNGGGGADTLVGGDGNDTLIGGPGAANTMQGGTGNDTYVVQAAGDSITEFANEGTDQVQTGLGLFILPANVENLSHTGGNDFIGVGNALDNILIGGSGNNYLIGGDGNDTLIGGPGNDTLQGGHGTDIYAVQSSTTTIVEGDNEFQDSFFDEVQTFLASYTLPANVEILVFSGASSHVGIGNFLPNVIIGNDGDDVLDGGFGPDTLTGGGGADQFVLNDALGVPGNYFDHITDFQTGIDKLVLSTFRFDRLSAGALADDAFAVDTASTASTRIIYNSTTGVLSYDADGSGVISPLPFAVIDQQNGNPVAVHASDFLIT